MSEFLIRILLACHANFSFKAPTKTSPPCPAIALLECSDNWLPGPSGMEQRAAQYLSSGYMRGTDSKGSAWNYCFYFLVGWKAPQLHYWLVYCLFLLSDYSQNPPPSIHPAFCSHTHPHSLFFNVGSYLSWKSCSIRFLHSRQGRWGVTGVTALSLHKG